MLHCSCNCTCCAYEYSVVANDMKMHICVQKAVQYFKYHYYTIVHIHAFMSVCHCNMQCTYTL